ncbi:MAG: 50S ribosomal protein L11 methyltransferase [Bacteroidales bacterium]|nr:50S ribosomal protein L11 methyltransferase [Bacteroidales bacterium]
MNYIEFTYYISPKSFEKDILIARLAEIGFDSFVDTETGFQAYVSEKQYDENKTEDLNVEFSDNFKSEPVKNIIEDQNWNAEWEKNFEAVIIKEKCSVRAPFHKKPKNIEFDIIIEPKMSFGTAHHETTSLMIELLLGMNIKGLDVLDMGCGTGVLAILASKMGAKNIVAIDNDEWAFNNTIENIEKNNVSNIDVLLGDAALLEDKKFDVIIANINRNILLADIKNYAPCLKENGYLLMSGFFEKDLELIKKAAEKVNIKFSNFISKNNWVAVVFS